MEITSYQESIKPFANHHKELGPYTLILIFGKHFGDFTEKLYKILENNEGNISEEDKFKLGISMGDMINDITNMATDIGISMEDVLNINLRKIEMAFEELKNDRSKFST